MAAASGRFNAGWAAASLGANRWQTVTRVILPELLPPLITGFALAFARALGEYGSVVFISGNMPMRTEIDPLPAMAAHQGLVGVPVIMAAATPLKFREWTPGVAMVAGDFGALIPTEGAWVTPQVVIVPLLAFDARGFRLGYGGGFYDRTLQVLRAKGPVLAIGFAFEAQEVDEVPTDEFDQKLDMAVTEKGPRWFA